ARFDTPVVLTIDQFEEVFTLCLDESERHAFVDNLLHLVQTSTHRHTIILTMRSDYESYLATMPLLQALFEQNAVRVDAMTAGELREAVEKPAEMVGLKFQEGLVDELLREIVGEPAALPLLQFALLRLWEMRERNRVTWDAYRRLGSVSQALATTADALYAALIPEEQVTARRILLRLVRPSEGLEVTRNRIPRRLLYQAGEAPDRVDRVLDKLIQARLVHLTPGATAADDQLEVAHEALVRNWPMLVSWLDEERILLRQRLRLTSLAQNWEARGRDPDALLRGALLKEAQAYEDLNSLEQEFLQASQAAQAREEAQKEAARQRELQTARQLAEEQQQRAEAERQRAEAQAVAAQRLRWISIALLVGLLVAVGSAVLWINNLNLQNTAARADATAAAIAAQSTTEALRASLANATIQAEQTQTANQVATSQAQTAGRATAVAAADATVRAATATAQYDAALATQAAIAAAQVTPTPIPRTPQGSAPTDTPEPTATPDPAVVAAQLAVDAQLQARVRERDQMPMLYVSGRPFLMGSPADSPEAAADELPAHAVTLDDYFIDQYEVTVQQYAAFLNDIGGYRGLCGGFDCIETGAETQYTYLLNNLGVYEPKAGYESFPANWVTWHGAQAYCSWAGARLPTEAEWEYAARGIDGRIYPWGSDLPAPSRAVSGWPNTDRGFLDALQPVSALPDGAGAFGAYGMAGGVAEWVQDWYDPTYYAANPGGAPNTAADSGQRVLRGGAWYSPAADVRATARDAALPTIDRSSITQQLRYRGVGFRCAADAGP
ncbi:MAG: SUMF1/EgtB/PvdO family nonheme iron enzyme, partial [Anaerolineales bacterium]|nr:SUMF1/EgtB/PvdO family nonheme iron enzyme [Anaerolineales bacterium]